MGKRKNSALEFSSNSSVLRWHSECLCLFMMDVALSIFALVAGGVTLELFTVARAPVGYQDERGFHFGKEAKDRADSEAGNPS